MKTSFFLIAAVVGATALAAPARAADVAEAAGPVAYDWSGVYAGISGGYGWTDVTHGWTTWTYRGLGTWDGDVDETLSANGGMIGATIGLNHQFDKVVIGLEADISYAGMGTDGQAFDGNIWAPGDSSVETWTTELEWLGTIRGRAGYAFDRFLVYGTAGLAIGGAVDKTRFDYDSGSGSSRTVSAQDRNTHLGWTAGVGIEAAVTEKLTAKLEYLHADLGEATYMENRGDMVLTYADMSIKTDIVRIGLNYRF